MKPYSNITFSPSDDVNSDDCIDFVEANVEEVTEWVLKGRRAERNGRGGRTEDTSNGARGFNCEDNSEEFVPLVSSSFLFPVTSDTDDIGFVLIFKYVFFL